MTTTTGRAIVADWISKCGLKDRPAKTTPSLTQALLCNDGLLRNARFETCAGTGEA